MAAAALRRKSQASLRYALGVDPAHAIRSANTLSSPPRATRTRALAGVAQSAPCFSDTILRPYPAGRQEDFSSCYTSPASCCSQARRSVSFSTRGVCTPTSRPPAATSSSTSLSSFSSCAQSAPCFNRRLFSTISRPYPARSGSWLTPPASWCSQARRSVSLGFCTPTSRPPAATSAATSLCSMASRLSTSSTPLPSFSTRSRPPAVTQVSFDNEADVAKETWVGAKEFFKNVSILRRPYTSGLNQLLSGPESNMLHFSAAGSSLADSLNLICLANSNRGYCIKKYLTPDNLLIAPRLCAFRLKHLDLSDIVPEDGCNFRSENYRAAGAAFYDLMMKELESEYVVKNLSPAVKDLFNKWENPVEERLIIVHPTLRAAGAAFYDLMMKELESEYVVKNLSPAVKDLFNKWENPVEERLIIDHPTLLSYLGKAACYQRLHVMMNRPSKLMSSYSANLSLKFSYAESKSVFDRIKSSPFLTHIHENRMVPRSSAQKDDPPAKSDSSNSNQSSDPAVDTTKVDTKEVTATKDQHSTTDSTVNQDVDPTNLTAEEKKQKELEEEKKKKKKHEEEKKKNGSVLVSLHRHCSHHWCDKQVEDIKIKFANGEEKLLWPFTEDEVIDHLDTVFPTYLVEAHQLVLQAGYWKVFESKRFWGRELLRFGDLPTSIRRTW